MLRKAFAVILIAITIVLASCNLDSDDGIFHRVIHTESSMTESR